MRSRVALEAALLLCLGRSSYETMSTAHGPGRLVRQPVYVPNQRYWGAEDLEIVVPGNGGLNDRFDMFSYRAVQFEKRPMRVHCVYSFYAVEAEAFDIINNRPFLNYLEAAVQGLFAHEMERIAADIERGIMFSFDEPVWRETTKPLLKGWINRACSEEYGERDYVDKVKIRYLGEFSWQL